MHFEMQAEVELLDDGFRGCDPQAYCHKTLNSSVLYAVDQTHARENLNAGN